MPAPPANKRLEERARQVADEVMAMPLPPIAPAVTLHVEPSVKIGHHTYSFGKTIEACRAYALDAWRRGQVTALVERHAWAREVAELAMELLPYRSPVFRYGWDAVEDVRDGRCTLADLEAEGRRFFGSAAATPPGRPPGRRPR